MVPSDRVIVVTQRKQVENSVRKLLAPHGYKIEHSMDGTGIDLSDPGNRPAAILLDMEISPEAGTSFLRSMLGRGGEFHAHVPIVILSRSGTGAMGSFPVFPIESNARNLGTLLEAVGKFWERKVEHEA